MISEKTNPVRRVEGPSGSRVVLKAPTATLLVSPYSRKIAVVVSVRLTALTAKPTCTAAGRITVALPS
jgi:hypothetical protein